MYRKLILMSLIPLFGSESRSHIAVTFVTASASGISYTPFRPFKGKLEDRLQSFVLWIIFFNVCRGAIYSVCLPCALVQYVLRITSTEITTKKGDPSL